MEISAYQWTLCTLQCTAQRNAAGCLARTPGLWEERRQGRVARKRQLAEVLSISYV